MRPLMILLPAVLGLLLSACESNPKNATPPEPTYEQALSGNTFNAVNYNAVAELMKRYQAPASASNSGSASASPFIVATLVNIDQLEQSSTLGRVISEQITSRLAQIGLGVVELKVRNGVYMKRNEGEFLLTREIKEVASAHKAQAVIVGTYAESASFIYVSLKIVNPGNSIILAAYDYALPLDRQIRSMLRKSAY
jgi:TolB-like protein